MTDPTLPAMPDPTSSTKAKDAAQFAKTFLKDFEQEDFQRTMERDLKDVYEFYLDRDTRRELDEMGHFSKGFYLTVWILKNSLLKLSPSRRLLLAASVFFFLEGAFIHAFTGSSFSGLTLTLGFLMLMLVLVLELKDKLLAQDELATGRAVQFALMPKESPALPGWETWLFTRPANEVGGDLVDYLWVDDDRLGLALGDVAGKGLGAALVMAKLQATLRALSPGFDTLDDLGEALNVIFRRDGLPNRFVSLAYLEIAPGTGRVRLLNAGHLPPLVLHDGRTSSLPKGDVALGLMDAAAFTEQAVDLAPGDVLLVYSDGLPEARNEAGDFFGEARLRALLAKLDDLPAAEVGELLLTAVERFIEEARPSDDLSLIVLRRTGEAPEHALPSRRLDGLALPPPTHHRHDT